MQSMPIPASGLEPNYMNIYYFNLTAESLFDDVFVVIEVCLKHKMNFNIGVNKPSESSHKEITEVEK